MIFSATFVAAADKKTQKPASQASKPKPKADQLSALLLSSAWCSFSYNKVSGTSKTIRVVFSPSGTWSLGGRAETYSSGDYGSVAGQHDSEGGGMWKVENGQLFMSNPPQSYVLEPVDLQVTQNSNGYPILKADGVEYSQCR